MYKRQFFLENLQNNNTQIKRHSRRLASFYIKSHLTWGVEKCHNVYLTLILLACNIEEHEYNTTQGKKLSNKKLRVENAMVTITI